LKGNHPLGLGLSESSVVRPPDAGDADQGLLRAYRPPAGSLLSADDEIRIARRIEDERVKMRTAALGSPLAAAALRALVRRTAAEPGRARLFAGEMGHSPGLLPDWLRVLEQSKREHWSLLRRLDRATKETERKRIRHDLGLAQDRQREALAAFGLTDAGLAELCDELVRATERRHSTNDRSVNEAIHRSHHGLVTARSRYRAALNEMVSANVGLVISLAVRYRGRGLLLKDLIQEGSLGCLRAAEKFDHRRGCKFSTYAIWWIRQSLRRALSNDSRTIRLPVHVAERRSQVLRIQSGMEVRLGRRPTEDEMAQATGLHRETLRRLLQRDVEPLSLERPVGTEGRMRIGDLVHDVEASDPEDALQRKSLGERMQNLVHKLTAREALVISMRYGLNREREHTLAEIGAVLDVTRERVRQIELKAMAKLRRAADADLLRELL
jgi:RNA polymerase sigma factor (sigma-70 family)